MSIMEMSPAKELPVTLSEIKANARIDADLTEHDNLLDALQASAVMHFQRHTSRWLGVATFKNVLPMFISTINVAPCPLVGVESIIYYDENNQEQTLPVSEYKVDKWSQPAQIMFNTMPLTADRPDAVQINFTAGTEAAKVPADIKVALMAYVTQRYESPGNSVLQLPTFFSELVKSYRLWSRQ